MGTTFRHMELVRAKPISTYVIKCMSKLPGNALMEFDNTVDITLPVQCY